MLVHTQDSQTYTADLPCIVGYDKQSHILCSLLHKEDLPYTVDRDRLLHTQDNRWHTMGSKNIVDRGMLVDNHYSQ
jgi:hypothetical protein